MKKHLIIGGTGGIGSEVIRLLPEEDLIVNFSRTELNSTKKHLEDYNIDVLNDELPEIEELNSIIYCPGSINLKPINSLKEEDFLDDFKINVLGAVRVIKKYHRELKRNGGSIVMFSTVAAKVGMPFHSSVATAKSGVEGLVKSLAAEFAPKIRVNCIAPTVTDTSLSEKLLRNDKAKESTADRHPLKRYLDAEEVADLAVYLVSEKARGITGEIIGLDAGMGNLRV
jgi:NAD(P)-dependent dehydrogenase (short-subunit alcohol dehydrogenase family)